MSRDNSSRECICRCMCMSVSFKCSTFESLWANLQNDFHGIAGVQVKVIWAYNQNNVPHTERESFGLFGFAEIGPSHAEQIQSKFILKVNKLWRHEIFAFVRFKSAIYGRPLAFVELSTEIGWIMCRLNQQCKLNHADPCSWNSTCKYIRIKYTRHNQICVHMMKL